MQAPSARRGTGVRALILVLVVSMAAMVAACNASATATPTPSALAGPASAGTTSPGPTITADETPSGTAGGPTLTPVSSGVTISPGPAATRISSTQTDWGAILDALPDTFPIYPGVTQAEPPPEPVSAAFDVTDPMDRVVSWYRDTLAGAGFSLIDLSAPLEDGSRVLDVQSDIPECRIQLTFRPRGESTMIIVRYGAGCLAAGP